MNTFDVIEIDPESRHLCYTCIHIPKRWAGCLSTVCWHPCEIHPAPAVFAKCEDNGFGFWVVECPYYKRDKVDLEEYLASSLWINKKKAAAKRDNWTCQRCGKSMNLNVHHITYEHIPFEPLEDLVTLCKDCHRTIHKLIPEV